MIEEKWNRRKLSKLVAALHNKKNQIGKYERRKVDKSATN